jgi:hypothetical protein
MEGLRPSITSPREDAAKNERRFALRAVVLSRGYGRTAPSALSAYQEVDSGSFSTTAPVCGASMM